MRNTLFILWIVFISVFVLKAAEDEDCLTCHEDKTLTTERGGQEFPLYVDKIELNGSIHRELNCVSCHPDADVEEFPHPERLNPPVCGDCHDQQQALFEQSIHGQALKEKKQFAPTCSECHGKHNILSSAHEKSLTYKMNIPYLCGKCHREGAPVARVYQIPEHHILENYSESIHGEGLFKKGLIVTAACADCHSSHKILPHTNPEASTSPRNIAATCKTCHSRIEDVHVKVIEGEKWRKDPKSIPICTDCHVPHKARKSIVALSLTDRVCLNCHTNSDVHKTVEGKQISLFVDETTLKSSVHRDVTCVKCHSDVDPRLRRPCATSGKVDCGSCHLDAATQNANTGHGLAREKGIEAAPECKTCHGNHNVLSPKDERSTAFRANIPKLCGDCHRSDSNIHEMEQLSQQNALTDYSKSIHGRSMIEKGLLPSAVCSDCHTAHGVLNHKDSRSSVNHGNIAATCSNCHRGIYNEFTSSIHFSADRNDKRNLPSCTNCHSSHTIGNVGSDQFMTEVTHQCGSCHETLAETYLETMHGKAYTLGYLKSAKCSDCHTAHRILAADDPNSSISLGNIVATCQQCHEDANIRFTGYLTHATHHDPQKYPILYYTYWAMTLLLLGVFSFFGVHTLMWLPRSLRALRERKKHAKEEKSRYYIRRFEVSHRITHLFVIFSFMSLALTGMMLKFSSMPWAGFLAQLIGGVRVAGVIHRIAAVITFGYFISHVFLMVRKFRQRRLGVTEFFLGRNSMWFNMNDIRDFIGTIKWFLGKGPRPDYGKWTYWEKFDYFAVFWGVAVIGFSGLMLWFPEFFTKFVPGWLINVATIIHSDEALLAVGFIFTVHFFNTHLRPEAFPMDKVIFTGLVSLEEYKKDRPREYEALKESGQLKKVVVKDYVSTAVDRLISVIGYTFLTLGIILILLIIYSVLFGYK